MVWMLVFGSAAAGQEPKTPPAVGDPAPDFELPGSDGNTYKLSQFRGSKFVVLAWYPKAFTPGCTRECRSFAEQADAFKDLPVVYFTISVDFPDENRRFAESLGVKYPILSDPERSVARAYGVVDSPLGFAKRWTFIISPEGKIVHIDKAVKPDTHAKDVANWIRDFLAGSKS